MERFIPGGFSLKRLKAALGLFFTVYFLNGTVFGLPCQLYFSLIKLQIMLTLLWFLTGILCFWIFYKAIDWFENI